MEFVIVRFPETRSVFVDGQVVGETTQMLVVEQGHHIFDLGEPRNYQPSRLESEVTGTSALTPLQLAFTPWAAGGNGTA